MLDVILFLAFNHVMRKAFVIVGTVIVIGIAGATYYLYKQQQYAKESVPVAVDAGQLANTNTSVDDAPAGGPAGDSGRELPLPSELNLKMTFYAQAPFGDWDYPWQEACEEASILLVANTYFNRNWTREEFRDEILKLVDWETRTFGDYKHTDVLQNTRILSELFGLQSVVMSDPTYDDVRRSLTKGHFLIAFFAGKRLGNPFYKNGGPNYHVMVIKGFKEGEKIITADVGTKHGEDYVYTWDVVQNALHDYDEPIESGAKRMIEVIPPKF